MTEKNKICDIYAGTGFDLMTRKRRKFSGVYVEEFGMGRGFVNSGGLEQKFDICTVLGRCSQVHNMK